MAAAAAGDGGGGEGGGEGGEDEGEGSDGGEDEGGHRDASSGESDPARWSSAPPQHSAAVLHRSPSQSSLRGASGTGVGW